MATARIRHRWACNSRRNRRDFRFAICCMGNRASHCSLAPSHSRWLGNAPGSGHTGRRGRGVARNRGAKELRCDPTGVYFRCSEIPQRTIVEIVQVALDFGACFDFSSNPPSGHRSMVMACGHHSHTLLTFWHFFSSELSCSVCYLSHSKSCRSGRRSYALGFDGDVRNTGYSGSWIDFLRLTSRRSTRRILVVKT